MSSFGSSLMCVHACVSVSLDRIFTMEFGSWEELRGIVAE